MAFKPFSDFRRMNAMNYKIYSIAVALAVLMTACKKEKEDITKAIEPDAQTINQVDDNNQLKEEDDAASNELRDAIDKISSFSGARIASDSVKIWCGCSVDSININQKELVFQFDGTTYCGSPRRVRSGKIRVKLVKGQFWKQEGAVLGVTFDNFKITRFEPTRSWTFNGYKTISNVFGSGYLRWFGFNSGNDSLSFKERARNISVSYLPANASSPFQLQYSLARRTTWYRKQKGGALRTFFRADGDTSFNGLTKVDSWGTNRFGNTFTNNFVTPWISDELCGFRQPNSGELVHKAGGNTVSILLGVNPSGNISADQCAYGWKLKWTISSGATGEKVFVY